MVSVRLGSDASSVSSVWIHGAVVELIMWPAQTLKNPIAQSVTAGLCGVLVKRYVMHQIIKHILLI